MKILSNKITSTVKYGRIEIETPVGILEYSYQTGVDYDADYQLESPLTDYHKLTDEQLNEIDELISNEIK